MLLPMNERNEVVTVVAEKPSKFGGTVKVVRSEFDVRYRIAGGSWQTERQTAFLVYGDGLGVWGTTERHAMRRFAEAK